MPDQTVTVNQGGGADYTVLQTAIDDSDVTDGFYKVEIQDNARYSENITAGGSTGTPTIANYLWITATDGVYHAGVPGAGARVHPTAAGDALIINESFVRLEKLNVLMSSGSLNNNIVIDIVGDLSSLLIDRCIIDGQERNRLTSNGDCFYHNNSDPVVTLYNTIVIDAGRMCYHASRSSGTFNLEFVTSYRSSVNESKANEQGNLFIPRTSGSPTVDIYNNVAADTVAGSDWTQAGTPTTTGSNNASEDATALGTGPVTNIVPADAWTDPTNFDLTVKDASSALFEAGTDRSGSLPDARADATIDIVGTTRPATPSIGAFEFAAAADTIAVGRAIEVDVARTVTPAAAGSVNVSVGRAVEVDVARQLTPTASGAVGVQVGRALETDIARPITPQAAGSVNVALGTASEIDVARGITPAASGSAAVGVSRAVETDLARTITPTTGGATQIPVGRAIETDIARPITPVVSGAATVQFGRAIETDIARQVSPVAAGAVSAAVGRAVEADIARSVTPAAAGAVNVAVARATETDVARPVTPTPGTGAVPVGRAIETDVARPITPVVSGSVAVQVGRAVETDLARGILPTTSGASIIPVNRAIETDVARPVTPVAAGSVTVGFDRAIETDLARTITPAAAGAVTVPLGRSTEVDLARPIAAVGPDSVVIGRATEVDVARPITPVVAGAATVLVGRAVELDIGRSITPFAPGVGVPVGRAIETDIARSITPVVSGAATVLFGRAIETDVARAVIPAAAGSVAALFVRAVETDVARPILAVEDSGTVDAFAMSIKQEIDRDPTPITLVEIVQVKDVDPWDLASVADGQTADINCKHAPWVDELFATGNTKETDTTAYMAALDVPGWFDDTSIIILDGLRYHVIQVERFGTERAPVGVVALIRR